MHLQMISRKDHFTEIFTELVRRASCDLPRDVENALKGALGREEGISKEVISVLLENIRLARKESGPMCQDTGLHTWTVRYPSAWDAELLRSRIVEATVRATKLGYLRPNAVNPVTGANSGDNTGLHHPIIELGPWKKSYLTADLLLKGGGSENVSSQLSLPDASIGAGRDLDGVRRAVLKMIHAAQGRGCSPGIAGVCIGGDRQTGYKVAKAQLKRQLGDRNGDRTLAALEKVILEEANSLDVGPMGFGGRTTVLGVKIAAAARHPASFFVTMAYGCWALRRWSLKAGRNGARPVYSQKPFA
jgi:fumarate hydratase class I